jgi:hypothetical protein
MGSFEYSKGKDNRMTVREIYPLQASMFTSVDAGLWQLAAPHSNIT